MAVLLGSSRGSAGVMGLSTFSFVPPHANLLQNRNSTPKTIEDLVRSLGSRKARQIVFTNCGRLGAGPWRKGGCYLTTCATLTKDCEQNMPRFVVDGPCAPKRTANTFQKIHAKQIDRNLIDV